LICLDGKHSFIYEEYDVVREIKELVRMADHFIAVTEGPKEGPYA